MSCAALSHTCVGACVGGSVGGTVGATVGICEWQTRTQYTWLVRCDPTRLHRGSGQVGQTPDCCVRHELLTTVGVSVGMTVGALSQQQKKVGDTAWSTGRDGHMSQATDRTQ